MTTMKVLGAVVALVAVAGIVAWLAGRDSPTPPADPRPARSETAAADSPRAPRTRHAAPTESADAPVSAPPLELPPPIDLASCDRDLDIFGTVVDANDKGIGGARISAVTYPWRAGADLNVRDRDVEVAGPSTRSAADGTFSLRLTRGAAVALRVAADGFASVELQSVLAGANVRVTLRPGVNLIVALADSDGKPVAGADVRLFNNNREGAPSINTRGKSGADGICRFENLPPGSWAWIAPDHAKGYAGWTKVDLPPAGEKKQEIVIPAGRTITGTVIDATTRSAVAGARVGMNWVLDLAVTTKADGSFELPGWTGKGVSDVHVLAEGFARESKKVGSAERLDFELQPGYAVTGRVTGADAAPVAGALVSLIASDRAGGDQRISTAYATTDAEGRFRATSLRVGMRHVIVVSAPGHARLRRDTPVATSAEDVALGDVALGLPRRVEGVVVDSNGAPQSRVPVTLGAPTSQRYEENSYGRSVSTFTDDLGRFRFADVAPGAYSVTARATGTPETVVDVTVAPDADLLDVKVARESTREIVVTVTDSAGAPVADAVLSFSHRTGKSVDARTDLKGVGRVGVAAGATVQLHVWVISDAAKFLQFQPRDLADGETDVRVVLEIGKEVTGRLVDPDGAGVAGASVRFMSGEETKAFAVTDGDGKFRATVPANGTTTLVFDSSVRRANRYEDSGLSAQVEGVAPGSDLVVRCERVARDGKMTVIVVSPDGKPVKDAMVTVSTGVGAPKWVKTDADGRAAFSDLPARELSVSAWIQGRDFLSPSGVKAVPQGQELRLVGRTATTITGTVVGEDGTSPAAAMVNALRDGKVVGNASIGLEGRFTLLLPAEDTVPVRLQVADRLGNAAPSGAVLDGVAPGTQDVRIGAKK